MLFKFIQKEDSDMKLSGPDIFTLRKSLGITLSEFSMRFGVSHGLVHLWESGDRRLTDSYEEKIREQYKLTIEDVIEIKSLTYAVKKHSEKFQKRA
jgi:transcriptional regulator with XRE-family HTH domain